jgi:hypothetical protein
VEAPSRTTSTASCRSWGARPQSAPCSRRSSSLFLVGGRPPHCSRRPNSISRVSPDESARVDLRQAPGDWAVLTLAVLSTFRPPPRARREVSRGWRRPASPRSRSTPADRTAETFRNGDPLRADPGTPDAGVSPKLTGLKPSSRILLKAFPAEDAWRALHPPPARRGIFGNSGGDGLDAAGPARAADLCRRDRAGFRGGAPAAATDALARRSRSFSRRPASTPCRSSRCISLLMGSSSPSRRRSRWRCSAPRSSSPT